MRVLLVTSRFDLIGGSERYARDVLDGLLLRGHDVQVVCARGEDREDGRVHQIDGLDENSPSRACLAELRENLLGVDRVLLLSNAPVGQLRVLLSGPPLLRFVQDHTLFCPGRNKQHEDGTLCLQPLGSECLRRYYIDGGCSGLKTEGRLSLRFPLRSLLQCMKELELTRRARRVLVASNYMRKELLRGGLGPENLEVLPYFTRAATEQQLPRELPLAIREFLPSRGEPVLFCPARLTLPDKGIDFLLTALGRANPSLHLIIAGDGPARGFLEQKAQGEGLASRVHFAGWLGPGEIESLYSRCDAVVCPSVWNEPFGLVGIEAMAHGKPVVAFDCGGIPEWLQDGVTGLLCPRKDTSALSIAIDQVTGDRALARRLGESGRKRVEAEFRPALHLDRLEASLKG